MSLAGRIKKDLEMKNFKQTSRSQRASCAQANVLVAVPATFTEVQAEKILAIAKISRPVSGFAEQLVQGCAPERFTDAQAQCIHELLQLDADDLRATLVDAMEPCNLRRRLGSQCDLASSGLEGDIRREAEEAGSRIDGGDDTWRAEALRPVATEGRRRPASTRRRQAALRPDLRVRS